MGRDHDEGHYRCETICRGTELHRYLLDVPDLCIPHRRGPGAGGGPGGLPAASQLKIACYRFWNTHSGGTSHGVYSASGTYLRLRSYRLILSHPTYRQLRFQDHHIEQASWR